MANSEYTSQMGANNAPCARSSNGTPLFECICPDCGLVRIQDKRKIGSRCHPCAMRKRVKHGKSGTPIYRLWAGMIARCTYPSASHYKYYGGRGIGVCEEWRRSPEAFFEWAESNGYAEGLELDRIDAAGDYQPSNCRFITHQENSRLCRHVRCTPEKAAQIKRLIADGSSVGDAARVVGIPYMSAWHISKGHTWRDAK